MKTYRELLSENFPLHFQRICELAYETEGQKFFDSFDRKDHYSSYEEALLEAQEIAVEEAQEKFDKGEDSEYNESDVKPPLPIEFYEKEDACCIIQCLFRFSETDEGWEYWAQLTGLDIED